MEDDDFLSTLGVVASAANPGRRLGVEPREGFSSDPPVSFNGSVWERDLNGRGPAPPMPGSRNGVLSCSGFLAREFFSFVAATNAATLDGPTPTPVEDTKDFAGATLKLGEVAGKDRRKSRFGISSRGGGEVGVGCWPRSAGHRSSTEAFFSAVVGRWIFAASSGVEEIDNRADALTCLSTKPRPWRRVMLGRSSFCGLGLRKAGDGLVAGIKRCTGEGEGWTGRASISTRGLELVGGDLGA